MTEAAFQTKYITLKDAAGSHRMCFHEFPPAGGAEAVQSRHVVCVHGLTRNKWDFHKLAHQLCGKGFRYGRAFRLHVIVLTCAMCFLQCFLR